MTRPRTAYCGWCRSQEFYRRDAYFGDWICQGCGHVIDCDECGQTMSDDHDCVIASDPERH